MLSTEERNEIQSKITQKLNEALNVNLDERPDRRIEVCAELYSLYLTAAGRLFLQLPQPAIKRMRGKIIEKIIEFAPLSVARANAEYLAVTKELKELIERMDNPVGGDPLGLSIQQ